MMALSNQTNSGNKIIYISGWGRSGSTLIENFLQSRYKAMGLGELFFIWERGALWNERCSCGRQFHQCPFWTGVLEDAFGTLKEADFRHFNWLFQLARGRSPGLDVMDRAEEIASGEFGHVARALYTAIFARLGDSSLIDSSKYPLFGAALHASGVAEIHPLHIYRDPRAVAASWQRTRKRPEANEHQQYMAQSRSVLTSTARWLWFNRQALQLAERVSNPNERIAYEAFCQEPEATIARLADTFALKKRASVEEAIGHSVSGNPSRFSGDLSRISFDEGWKTELSFVQKAAISLLSQAYYRKLRAD